MAIYEKQENSKIKVSIRFKLFNTNGFYEWFMEQNINVNKSI